LENSGQWSVISNQYYPKNVEINSIVAMNQPISEPDNLRPGDARVLLPGVNAHPVCGLTDNFEEPDQSQT
jgi:hypothetical protein